MGNEANFTVDLKIIVNTMDGNKDVNLLNNVQSIAFVLDSESNIQVVSM